MKFLKLLTLIIVLFSLNTAFSQINVAAVSLTTSGDPYPENGMCPVSGRTLQVKIVNNGNSPLDVTITPVTISVNITGPINQTFSTVFNSGTPLSPGFSKYVNVTTAADFSLKGFYSVAMSATCTGDQSPGNEAVEGFSVEGNKLTLTSAPTTSSQTVCLNSSISTITYYVSGNATNVTATGMPPGVTSSFTYPNLTITGSPSSLAGSPFSYSVTSSGLCPTSENETLNGSMIVKALPTISIVDKTNDTLTCNDPIFVFNALGGTTYSWSTGASTSNISVSAPGKYILTGTANGCSNKDSIDVKQNITPPNPPVGTDVSRCGPGTVNLGVTSDAKTTVTWYGSNLSTVVGAGLNYTTPSINSTSSYYAEAKNTATGCVSSKSEIKGIIIPFNTASAPSTTPTVCANSVLTPITHTTTGATGIASTTTNYGLPTGLSASFNASTGVITISGTPTSFLGSPFNYSIPLTGGCGTVNATGTITVNPNNTATGQATATTCINTSLTPYTHSTTGATGIASTTTNYGLPTGVSASFNSSTGIIQISGTPTTSSGSPFSYSIPLTGGCGMVNATGTITVNPNNTVTGPESATLCINTGLSPITHTTTGATGIASTTTNYGLPTGLSASFNATTGIITISGTPTTSSVSPFSYNIPLSGGCGMFSATGTITVNPNNTVTGPLTASSCINVPTSLSHTSTGATGIASTTTNYGLPTGVSASFNSSTGIIQISGTPTSSTGSPFSYSIPLIGGCGTVNANGTITVNPKSVVSPISGKINLCVGEKSTLSSSTIGGVWSSSDVTITSVDNVNGLVTAIKSGSADIIYTVTINGCSNAVTSKLNVYDLPFVNNIIGNDSLCLGDQLTLANTTLGGVWTSDNSNVVSVVNGVIEGKSVGKTKINYTVTKDGCSTTKSKEIVVNSYPVVPAIGGASDVCVASTIQLTNTNSLGNWSSSDPTIASINAFGLVTGKSAGSMVISYKVRNLNCETTKTANITVKQAIGVSPIVGTTTICIGDNSQLTISTTGGTWSSSNTAVATVNPTTGLVSSVAVGSTIIKYDVVTNGVCPQSTAVTFTVNEIPTVNALSNISVCQGSSINTINFTGTGSTIFQWTNSNTNIGLAAIGTGNIGSFTANGTTIGGSSQIAVINVTPIANGCIGSSKNFTITVNSLDNAGFNYSSSTLCKLASNPLPVISGSTGGVFSSSSTGLVLNSVTGEVNLVNSSPGYYQITYTTKGSCPKDSTLNISISPEPLVSSTADQQICEGSSFSQINFNGLPGTIFNWTNDNPNIGLPSSGLGNISSFQANTNGISKITVTPYIGACSGISKTFKLTVNPKPVISPITGKTFYCVGESATLTSATVGGEWNSSDKTIVTIDKNNGVLTTLKSGSSDITYLVTLNGCSNALITKVNVNPYPVVSPITGNQDLCLGSNSQLTNSTQAGVWSSSNPSLVTVNATGLVNSISLGTATISYSVTSNGCTTTNSTTVTSYENKKLNLKQGVVSENSVDFIWDNIKDVAYNYSYKINGSTSSTTGSLPLGSTSYSVKNLNPGDSVYFTLQPNSTSVKCINQESVKGGTIKCIYPNVKLYQVDTTLCLGAKFSFKSEVSNINQKLNYNWFINGTQITNDSSLFVTQSVQKNDKIRVKVIGSNVCENNTEIFTKINDLQLSILVLDMVLANVDSLVLKANPDGGVFSGSGVVNNKLAVKSAGMGSKKINYNYNNPLNNCKGQISKNVMIYDTVFTCKKTIYDTLKVTKYDTVIVKKDVYDTITITKNVTKYDTVIVKKDVYDTIVIKNTIYDTVRYTVTDTVSILKLKFKLTTGIKAKQETSMRVYPNPTSDILLIEAEDQKALAGYKYKIVDAAGKEVYFKPVVSMLTEISLKSFGAAGTYFFEVFDEKHERVISKKIILE